MATKTLFLRLTRPSDQIPWGFSLTENRHRRLSSALIVQEIVRPSPAYEAGLFPGDIVLGVDNSPITGRPLTYSLAKQLLNLAKFSIELQVLRESAFALKNHRINLLNLSTTMYAAKTPETYRPLNRGMIPSLAQQDSGVRLPDNNVQQYLNEKAREQWAITKQTYRSAPLIEAKPKVRRDWPTGCYLRHMDGPGWHDPPKHIIVQDPSKLKLLNQLNQNDGPSSTVHLQYNSPINLYSQENLNNNLQSTSLSPGRSPSAPPSGHSSMGSPLGPSFNAKTQFQPNQSPAFQQQQHSNNKPLTVDITNSPTYQFLQEQQLTTQQPQKHRLYSPITGQHSPNHSPKQTPYFHTLMHAMNISEY